MAGVDALISKVVDLMASAIEQEFKLVGGAKKEVKRLTYNLQSIRAVLDDAERRQWKETTTVQLWLDRLKTVAYDIDDVVDEWSYEILKSQNQEENAHVISKVWSFNLLYACYCFPKGILRYRMAVKIGDLNARLDVIAVEKDRYSFQLLGSNDGQVERSITTSDIDISEVKGRGVDKEKLVSMLLGGSSEMSKLRLITMVGMGGIGKTTLARLVYNDERVKSHFHRRIWVCVSHPFDEIRIAKEILESLQGVNSNLVALPNITRKIRESFVEGKEYLFVLDDVWDEDPNKWKQLEDCLKGSLGKTRILVTTRNVNARRIMGCLESDIYRVGFLSMEECWELFCMIAFSGMSSARRGTLEEMGKEVVRRCKGLPLAVRAIAGLLRFKERRIEWQSVLDSPLWALEEVHKEIVGPLWLSYYDLPSPMRQCFSYCAIFPKDHETEKYELINHWIAQGYINGTQSKNAEMIGEEYFQILVMRSFLQDVEVRQDPRDITRTTCKMHDVLHDFAQLLVGKECLSVEVHDACGAKSLDDSVGNSLRHLSVSFRDGVQCPDSFYNLKKLRSFVIKPVSWSNLETFGLHLNKIFNKFTSLRSLTLHNCGIVEVPSNINRLIHLRELDLSDNADLVELPGTVWELYNMQILILDRCERLSSLKGLGRLANLRNLGNSSTYMLLPKDMVRVSGLRRLNWINLDVHKNEAFSLKHLKNFNQLSGSLAMRWLKRGDADVEDAKQAPLKNKRYVSELQLYFGSKEIETRRKQDEELVEALNMPPNLEFLRMYYYMGLRTPNWLDSLTVVKMVGLRHWWNCEHLPSLGTLPCLEDLGLWGFFKVRKVGAEFLGIDEMVMSSSSTIVPLFPKLKSLKFSFFHDWEEWSDVDGNDEKLIMPSLTTLNVYSCLKLKALPNFIRKKTNLELLHQALICSQQSTS